MSVDLREQANLILWPENHFLFVAATGPFAQTAPRAWRQARRRIEHYRNDPRTTPEAELITEILAPVS